MEGRKARCILSRLARTSLRCLGRLYLWLLAFIVTLRKPATGKGWLCVENRKQYLYTSLGLNSPRPREVW